MKVTDQQPKSEGEQFGTSKNFPNDDVAFLNKNLSVGSLHPSPCCCQLN